MKFGAQIEQHQERDLEWAPFYLSYNTLKDIFESSDHAEGIGAGGQPAPPRTSSSSSAAIEESLRLPTPLTNNSTKSAAFLHQLQEEVQRITLFVFDQSGRIASNIARCNDDLRRVTAGDIGNFVFSNSELSSGQLSIESAGDLFVVPANSSREDDEEVVEQKNQYCSVQKRYLDEAFQLLRLYKFLEVNITGIRKILKKHDKFVPDNKVAARFLGENPLVRHHNTLHVGLRPGYGSALETGQLLVKPLLSEDSLGALVVSIEVGLQQVERCMVENGWDTNTGSTFEQKKSRSKSHQHLARMQSLTTPLTSSHSSGALNTGVVSMNNDADFLILQLHAARRRLKQTNNVVRLLAAPLVLSPSSDDGGEEDIELAAWQQRNEINRVSNLLNFLSTFFYMTNYYIVAPSSGDYAKRLGGNAALASVIIGMTPLAALVSTVLYSWWTSYSYKHALLFASTCSVVGNLMYALGLPFNSLPLVMIGRLLNGFGSARSINRRYIADTYSYEERTAASATFVTAGALGMAAGPAIASCLHLVVSTSGSNNLFWQVENAPGVFMFVVWLLFLLCMIVYFEDPPKKRYQVTTPALDGTIGDGEAEPLLADASPTEVVPTTPPMWKNIPVMLTLFLYFVLKLNLEAVLSAAANVTELYFGWDPSVVGLFLAGLGLLMLPANIVIAYLSRTHDDRDLILGLVAMMFLGCILIVQYFPVYTGAQYIIASVILFVSSTALEGPNMSLLSKTIPVSWRKGVFNVGFLATESGTLGRTVADLLLAIFGSNGLEHLLNRTFGTFSLLSLSAFGLCFAFFDSLQSQDVDE